MRDVGTQYNWGDVLIVQSIQFRCFELRFHCCYSDEITVAVFLSSVHFFSAIQRLRIMRNCLFGQRCCDLSDQITTNEQKQKKMHRKMLRTLENQHKFGPANDLSGHAKQLIYLHFSPNTANSITLSIHRYWIHGTELQHEQLLSFFLNLEISVKMLYSIGFFRIPLSLS